MVRVHKSNVVRTVISGNLEAERNGVINGVAYRVRGANFVRKHALKLENNGKLFYLGKQLMTSLMTKELKY